MIRKSRPYQKDIENRAVQAKDNVLIMLPTGGGKTHIASEIAKRSGRVIFLAPKINLLDQTIASFEHLNPQKVHRTSKYNKEEKVFVSTIQTISRNPQILKNLNVDCIIIDEVHFGSSGNMQKIVREAHSGKIIGLSATPYTSEGKLIDGFDTIIQDYDISYLIEHKYLVRVEAMVPLFVNLKGIRVTGGDYNLKDLDVKMSNSKMITTVVSSTVKILKKKKKTLVFCTSIEHANKIAKAYRTQFREIGCKKKIKVLHSEIQEKPRKKILLEFAHGELDMIVSVDMITTGFDAPCTDSMVIARPTKSQNLYKQMIGRGTRTNKGKKYCLMLDCGNVVENLGMPLDSIVYKPRKKRDIKEHEKKNRVHCHNCRRLLIKKVIYSEGLAYTVCSSCGEHKEPYSPKDPDKCNSCNFMHSFSAHNRSYIINKYGIAIKCYNCKKITVLSLFDRGFENDDEIIRDVIEEIIIEIDEGNPVFFKEALRDAALLAYNNNRADAVVFFMFDGSMKDEKIYKRFKSTIDKQVFKQICEKQSEGFKRLAYVEFCSRYTKENNMDLHFKITKLEQLYFSKYGTLMPCDMYKKSAVAHIKHFFKKRRN